MYMYRAARVAYVSPLPTYAGAAPGAVRCGARRAACAEHRTVSIAYGSLTYHPFLTDLVDDPLAAPPPQPGAGTAGGRHADAELLLQARCALILPMEK